MCVIIYYQCPSCREPSGHSSIHDCPKRGTCGEPMDFWRFMKGEQFQDDWFCPNENCYYGRSNRFWEDQEIADALRRPLSELIPKEEGAVDRSENADSGNGANLEADNAHDNMSAESDAAAAMGAAARPAVDNELRPIHTSPAANHERNYGPLPSLRDILRPPVQPAAADNQPDQLHVGHQHVAPLPPQPQDALDQAAAARIDALMAIIYQAGHGQPQKWSAEEDELLELLRGQGLTNRTISEQYLQRSHHACETRICTLRKSRRGAGGN